MCALWWTHRWFHIDLCTSISPPIDFPPEAHTSGLSVPALFIGSEQFAAMRGLAEATQRLVASNSSDRGATAHVLQGSKHQNFTDIGYWIPVWLLRKVKAVGACDYYETHKRILSLTYEFLESHTVTPGGDTTK